MGDLINPRNFRIARVTHEANGVTLHEERDCPRDKTCPVWLDLHPAPERANRSLPPLVRLRKELIAALANGRSDIARRKIVTGDRYMQMRRAGLFPQEVDK